MKRMIPACLVLLAGSIASAQFITAGSTAPGDYLRGVGVAAWGAGLYNLNTARAERIQVDSFITLNRYLLEVKSATLIQQNRQRAIDKERRRQNYVARADRILNDPESRDIMNGDSLNATIRNLTRGEIDRTELRIDPVPLPADIVRRLPFQFNQEGKTLSLPRLLHEGHAAWPVAFQDNIYEREKKDYVRAVSDAIDQQIDGQVTHEVIVRLEKAVAAIERRFNELERLRPGDANLVNPARIHLNELKKSVELFKSQRIEKVVAVLDTYQGTTVHDFVAFMEDHKIAFAPAEWDDERRAYRQVYAALKLQREILDEKGRTRGR